MPAPDPMSRIEALLGSMTLEEKIGQMTLVSAGQAVTGPGGPVDYLQAIRAGGVGTVSNLWGPERAREVQHCKPSGVDQVPAHQQRDDLGREGGEGRQCP